MSFIFSEFWLSLLGVNIALACSVYPLAILGRLTVAPVAYFAIGAYATTYTTIRGDFLLVGLVVGVIISVLLGVILTKVAGHLRSHFFVVASLGVAMIVQQVAFSLSSVTNGYLGVTSPADIVSWWHIWTVALFFVVLIASLDFSVLNGEWRAIGEDDNIASALGINTGRCILIAGIMSAAMATVAGGLYGHLLPFFDPNAFGLPLILTLVASIVVGGVGRWYGPLIGSVVMTSLPELLRDLGMWREALTGFILITCVLFLPAGLSDFRGIKALWQQVSIRGVFRSLLS